MRSSLNRPIWTLFSLVAKNSSRGRSNLASTSKKFVPIKRFPRHRLASAVALIVALPVSLNVFAGTKCSPFGDPPAQVDRGWFASFVFARNSVCLGGKLLGPWTDGNGDARYACLYEPAHKGEREPLPMLVFLHPSETSAYSVILTGLVGLIDKGVLGEGASRFHSACATGSLHDPSLSWLRFERARVGQLVPAVESRLGRSP